MRKKTELVNDKIWIDLPVVWGILTAFFCMYSSILQLDLSFGVICIVSAAACLAAYICMKKKIVGILLVAAAAFVFFTENVTDAMLFFVNSFVTRYNHFYNQKIPLFTIEEKISLILLVLGVMEVLVACSLFCGLKRKGFMWIGILCLFFPMFLLAIVGEMPSIRQGWFSIAMLLCYYIWYRTGEYKAFRNILTPSLLFFLVLIILSNSVLSYLLQWKEENIEQYQTIKNRIIDFQELNFSGIREIETVVDRISPNRNFAKGGVGKGTFDGLEAVQPIGERALKVTVSMPNDYYLKAYVGTEYTSNGWKPMNGFKYTKGMGMLVTDSVNRELLNTPFARILQGENEAIPEWMNIQVLQASTEFAYTPYLSEITTDLDPFYDGYIKGNRKTEWDYQLFQTESVDYITSDMLQEENELWNRYLQFVQNEYVVSYPGLGMLTKQYENYVGESVEEITGLIDQYFQTNLVYSKTPGAMPEDMDFVEGFLYNKKQGFCVHFASAATLIYRICGVPARYVEGYVVPAEAFELNSDGTYSAIVSDRNAHAWCEVFEENFGWQVKEHTLSYRNQMTDLASSTFDPGEFEEDTNMPENESQEDPIDIEEEEQLPPVENTGVIGNETDTSEEKEQNETKTFYQVIWKGIITATCICVLFFILLLQKNLRRSMRMKEMKRRKENLGIKSTYHEIYHICQFCGIKMGHENERRIVDDMIESIGILTEEEWRWLYQIAEEATFSNRSISKEEHQQMLRLYKKLRQKIIENLHGWKRFVYLYMKAL